MALIALNEEREMTRNQRGLVDTCFEEGQYESGIQILEHLRSAAFKPPIAHIRQLLYIALFPPPLSSGDRTNEHEQIPPSPVKGPPTKQKPILQKASFSPTVVASEAAQRLLLSFLSTNSPESLFRALPSYPLNKAPENGVRPEPSNDGHDEDSIIARESLCIRDCKNCWIILRSSFIQRKKLFSPAGDVKKKRGRSAYDIEDVDFDNGSNAPPAPVAEHAWPVLDWLLSLFEKDESLTELKSGAKFSPLLLSQIPPPRGGSGQRWEADAPLDIIFHCVQQQRQELAVRLWTLLIDLSLTTDFDVQMFIAAVATRIYSSSPEVVQTLMSSLPKTVPVLIFKVALCQRFLSTAPSVSGGAKPRPKPQARRATRRNSEAASSNGEASVTQNGSSATITKPAHASSAEILQLVENGHESQNLAASPLSIDMKYALLTSYALLQGLLPPVERDGDWQDALAKGRVKNIIGSAFPTDSDHQKTLVVISSLWSSGQEVG
ncbi:hypothetical protein HYDPIDRAFT_83831 [Hydnomerulius pinastri MD-312]|nr:hypothetical protein HYDPIDRAFT_83831 [Hydnomerulius pinastri MD-312]